MRHHRFIAFGLLALFVSSLAIGAQGALENVTYKEGYVDWEMDIEQRLYVEGENAETSVLQRARPDATLAFADVTPNSGLNQIFSLTSEPLVNPIRGSINISTFFSAYLVPQAGLAQSDTMHPDFESIYSRRRLYNPCTMTASISGTQVYETTITHIMDTIASNDPQNFSGDIQPLRN